MTIHKGSLFLGFRKNKYGGIEKIYYDPEYKSSPEFRNVITSIEAGTGLRGGGLSFRNAKKTINNYVDTNFSHLHITRRNFLKTAAITAITGSLFSCKKDENPIEEIVDPPTPVITGPTELTIPHVGMGAIGTFDSVGTMGATDLNWQQIKPLSGMDTLEQAGSGPKINIKFAIPGDNEVILIADNIGGRARTTHLVKVNPPKLPEKNYDLPLLLVTQISGYSTLNHAIYTLDLKTNEVTRLFSGKRYYKYIGWEPTGQRMVFVTWPGADEANYPEKPYKITTYDFTKGTFKDISNNSSGLAWYPSWSPKGDWIAYLDDSKAPNYALDVVALMRPDGSDQFYLDGKGQSPEFSGQSLSWDPEGKRLIAGINQKTNFKMVVIDGLFSGSPRIDSILPKVEQIERYYDAEAEDLMLNGVTKSFFMEYFYVGANGVAWSPDGANVVYTANFGIHPENYYAILSSRIDGTGDIQKIASSHGESGSGKKLWLPIGPTWTPDGSAIFFTARNYNIESLFKYDIATKSCEKVILPIDKVRLSSLYG